MSNEKILIVDDDSHIRNAIAESLKMEGYGIVTAGTGEEALEILKKGFLNIVLSDLKMPGMNGVEVLKQVKNLSPDTEVILMTAYGTVETAVGAMKLGAYDYIIKPIDLSELDFLIIRCLEKQRLTQEVGEFKELVNLYEVSRAIGSVMKLQDLLDFIIKLACETLFADGGSIMLLDEKTKGELVVKASVGHRGDLVLEKKIKLGERVAGYVAQENQPILIDGEIADDIRFSNLEGFDGIKSGMSVPLTRKNKVIGVINLNRVSEEKKFGKRDLNLLSIFASQAAIAIENTYLFSQLEKEKEKLKTIFSEMGDGAVITDEKFSIIMINQSAQALLGLKGENSILKNFFSEISDFTPSIPFEKMNAANTSQSFNLTREKGKLLYLSVLITKILDEEENTAGYIFVLRDVTSEKKEEKIKRNFFSLISHKLRNPLVGITAYIPILRRGKITEKLDDMEKKAFETVEHQSKILTNLVDKLLKFASLESEFLELNKEKLYLYTLVKESLESFSLSENTEIDIDASVERMPDVFADKVRLQQVLQNLVENAIKFNNKEKKLVKIKAKLSENNFVAVLIEDNGVGIPSEEIPKLFRKFYQIEEYFTGQVEGAGLGLAFVKRIIEAHNGKVWVESEPDKGSRFYFTLPIKSG